MTDQPSGKLYTAVTKYWPRIAIGLVAAVGGSGWLIEGLTADSGIEFYLMAWGGTTGGLWFLFDRAETAASEQTRAGVAEWMTATDFNERLVGVPDHFASLFDRTFGEKIRSWSGFIRSSLASAVTVSIIFAIEMSGSLTEEISKISESGDISNELVGLFSSLTAPGLPVVLGVAVLWNIIPDYLSLIQTRWAIGWAQRSGRVVLVLIMDFLATISIALTWMLPVLTMALVVLSLQSGTVEGGMEPWTMESTVRPLISDAPVFEGVRAVTTSYVRLYLLSGFFTSAWLWLYILALMASRVLIKMGGGVGFLLLATDVEKQPFRSMGFVSVIIVSALFALGLPLVLL